MYVAERKRKISELGTNVKGITPTGRETGPTDWPIRGTFITILGFRIIFVICGGPTRVRGGFRHFPVRVIIYTTNVRRRKHTVRTGRLPRAPLNVLVDRKRDARSARTCRLEVVVEIYLGYSGTRE